MPYAPWGLYCSDSAKKHDRLVARYWCRQDALFREKERNAKESGVLYYAIWIGKRKLPRPGSNPEGYFRVVAKLLGEVR